jgi:hypothetical protein
MRKPLQATGAAVSIAQKPCAQISKSESGKQKAEIGSAPRHLGGYMASRLCALALNFFDGAGISNAGRSAGLQPAFPVARRAKAD